jgi:hypothetical protein
MTHAAIPGPNDVQAAAAATLPRDFASWRGYHDGESILVCGCGASLSDVVAPERLITIGVNDVGRLFDPDYLVVLNPRHQFAPGRFPYVENSRAKAIFTQLNLGIAHPYQVPVHLSGRGSCDLSNSHALPYTRNSPYPAVCLAAHMGARRIGLIGVDFTDHHFFGPTGPHSLVNEVERIDQEYRQLYENAARRGIEIFNLSAESRLTGIPKISPGDFLRVAFPTPRFTGRRIFFVNYRFLSCGTVFRDGLAHAAEALGLDWRDAYWGDADLEDKIAAFQPELVLVVHGRKFAARWRSIAQKYPSAVWLLDEPYEVDDTSRFSGLFRWVFVSDPGTLDRHRNARYMPVCYDPSAHTYRPGEDRWHAVGFIGGYNPTREEALARLAGRGLLSYVVGGPWRDPAVQALCLSPNIPAADTAELYRRTRIVVNLFRTRHHYNASGIPATSLNPRVYEALACGALVISERRPELTARFPEMPAFDTLEEMEFQVERHLRDADDFARARKACIRRGASHTYESRLAEALSAVFGPADETVAAIPHSHANGTHVQISRDTGPVPLDSELPAEWKADPGCMRAEAGGVLVLHRESDGTPGSERGLAGTRSHGDVTLEFEVLLQSDTEFIAKIHQPEADNQLANSYHLLFHGGRGYLARHAHILNRLNFPLDCWITVSLSYRDGAIVVRLNGVEMARAADRMLETGYCFLGVKAGTARLRSIRIVPVPAPEAGKPCAYTPEYEVIAAGARPGTPALSIVTTVYDRMDCLDRCLRSTEALHFRDYEQIVVADSPPPRVLEQIAHMAARRSSKVTFARLKTRHNDWGIAPAAAGLSLARGRYVSFLSDDNGYVPGHFDRLVEILENDRGLGFVYSSCLYDGRLTLGGSPPRPGRIDLGQPLFRRELFDRYLGGSLPFHEFGWDWRMIESFLRAGVRWRHVDDATFIFRLAKYPHLIVPAAAEVR